MWTLNSKFFSNPKNQSRSSNKPNKETIIASSRFNDRDAKRRSLTVYMEYYANCVANREPTKSDKPKHAATNQNAGEKGCRALQNFNKD